MNEGKDILREYFKKWPTFYFVVATIFGPVYTGRLSAGVFLKECFPKENKAIKVLNLGSGPKILRADIINVDIGDYKEVDVQADLAALPFESNSVDGFVCDNVLEHVSDPYGAVSEMYRVLKPGSVGYVSTPFLYPFHASPYDYSRWTAQGLRLLFKDFEIVEIGARSGFFSTLTVWACYLIPTLFSFGSSKLYWILVNVSLFIFFPIKFLDIFANHLPFASNTAAVLYCVVKKK